MKMSLFELLKDSQIVIPMMQRDYVQGRKDGKVPLVRKLFLDAIFSVLRRQSDHLELDFIYGYRRTCIKHALEIARFIPLDGQQRLTTLFLLHWFVAVKESRHAESVDWLPNFTYETRHSSRLFCSMLAKFVPCSFSTPIDQTIVNEPWFFSAWIKDPTIASMLTMLGDIERNYDAHCIANAWDLLTGEDPKIVFHLLPMEQLGLPDDLYLKMNSRGKELTEFEYFKSKFAEVLPLDLSEPFTRKIDQQWTDLFWELYKDQSSPDIAKLADAGFLRFFRYLTDMLAYRDGVALDTTSREQLVQDIYVVRERAILLFDCLNALYERPPSFFLDHFYTVPNDFSASKVRLFSNEATANLLKKCADKYDPSLRNNPFPIGEQLLLFACIMNLIAPKPNFAIHLRTLRNLINNSTDEVRKEYMKPLLDSVFSLMDGKPLATISAFNKTQLDEEVRKLDFLITNPENQKRLYRLEDHHLTQGCLAAFALDSTFEAQVSAFDALFYKGCDYSVISKALLCIGDYSQSYGTNRRLGTCNESVWREFMVPSRRRHDFSKSTAVLRILLDIYSHDSSMTPEAQIKRYLADYELSPDKPKDWRYYFIKYPEYSRENDEGFFYWPDFSARKHECIKFRRHTFGGFNWSPILYTIHSRMRENLELDPYNKPLKMLHNHALLQIRNMNKGYKVEPVSSTDQWLIEKAQTAGLIDQNSMHVVRQNEGGEDLDDRIEKGILLIQSLLRI